MIPLPIPGPMMPFQAAARHRLGNSASVSCVAVAALGLMLLAGCQSRQQPEALSLESRLRLAGTLDASQGSSGGAALAVLKDAVVQRPRDAALQERLAAAAEQAGDYGDAIQALRAVAALQGPGLGPSLALGRLELRNDNPAAAIVAYQQASTLAPGSVAALGGLGLAHDMTGDHALAQTAYRSALTIAPRNWAIRSNLAMSLMLSRQAAAAADSLAEAEFLPGVPRQARHNLALALAALGQRDRMIRVLRLDMGQAEAVAVGQELVAVAAQIDPGAISPQVVAMRQASPTPRQNAQ